MIITIDGPAASGKSTAARLLAQRLGIAYLDTGAMYRAVTLAAVQRGTDLANGEALARVAGEVRIDLEPRPEAVRVLLDGRDVTAAIRENDISRRTHRAASNERVRACLVEAQRRIARLWGDLVTEGRDQGTVVFPEADVKVYLDASEEVRADRRQGELAARGRDPTHDQVLEEIRRRDDSDRSRPVAPRRVPDGAVVVDTSQMSIDDMVDHLEKVVRSRVRER